MTVGNMFFQLHFREILNVPEDFCQRWFSIGGKFKKAHVPIEVERTRRVFCNASLPDFPKIRNH